MKQDIKNISSIIVAFLPNTLEIWELKPSQFKFDFQDFPAVLKGLRDL